MSSNHQGQTLPRWEDTAKQWLQENAGSIPYPDLIKRFNQMASIRGWQRRTERGIRKQLSILGLPQRCIDENLSFAGWGQAFNIRKERVMTWERKGLVVRRNGVRTIINSKSMGTFLVAHPEEAWGIERWRLAGALGDDVANEICTNRPNHNRGPRPVICITTGIRYPHAKAAGDTYFVSRDAIAFACKHRTPSANNYWAYVDEMEELRQ